MLPTLYESNLNVRKAVQHPIFPFVYSYRGKLFCIHHFKKDPMNKGAMRQHIQGKLHRLNFDTGEPIIKPGIPQDVLAQIKMQKQEPEIKPTPVNFDQLKSQLEIVLDDPQDVKDILAKHAFDEKIKNDIEKKLDVKNKIQILGNYLNMLNVLNSQPIVKFT